MAEEVRKSIKAPKKGINVLPPRIHVDEFLQLNTELTPMERAGFKVTVKKEWMRKAEWEEQLELYLDR